MKEKTSAGKLINLPTCMKNEGLVVVRSQLVGEKVL